MPETLHPEPPAAPAWSIGNALLLPASRQLLIDGTPAQLGARAFDLLLALVEMRDRVVSKGDLLTRVWRGLVVEENNLQVHISTLRKLLGPQAIATIPGQGYQFTAAVSPASALGRPATWVPASGSSAPAAGTPGGGARQETATPTAGARGNLPGELPPIFGREEDLDAVSALLRHERLVTVVGAGGIGKTTLAQAVAQRELGIDADGVWVVELAPVAQPGAVGDALSSVLGMGGTRMPSAETLASDLSCSRMLIVLDNCEHLVGKVATYAAALLRSAPGVRLLATSQEPLKVPGEQVYRLSSLAVPDDPDQPDAARCGALALFAARARATDATFTLDAPRTALAATICRRLDGIALAIELAAARLPLLGLQGLHDRLDERFHVLTGGSRLALRRHQTLRAALDWSHGLLTTAEQRVFRRLGVFLGSFGLEAAQQVACDEDTDPWAVLEHLGALVDKSLVVTLPGPVARYRLLETNRAFALERLEEAGETSRCLTLHAAAVLDIFEESRCREYEFSFEQRLSTFLPDIDNLRAALDWAASAPNRADFEVALAGAAAWIWSEAGLRPAGMRYCRAAIARIDATTPASFAARLLGSWSMLAHPLTGPYEIDVDQRAVALYAEVGDRQGYYVSLCELARTLSKNQRYEESADLLRQAEPLFEPGWPPVMEARWLIAKFWLLAETGDIVQAMPLDERIQAIARSTGETRLETLAMIHLEQRSAALGRWAESLARSRELQDRMARHPALRSGLENMVLINLGTSLVHNKLLEEAGEVMRQALPCEERAGRAIEMYDPLALLAFRRGLKHSAARLHGSAEQFAAAGTLQRQLVERQMSSALRAELDGVFAPNALRQLMSEGHGLTVREALELATATQDSPAPRA